MKSGRASWLMGVAGLHVVICSSHLNGQTPEPPGLPGVPKEKQTTLGLYLTAREAYAKWEADPAGVKILDVRAPEEVLFVGHPAMSWNVPFMFQTLEWDSARRRFPMKPNADFVEQVGRFAGKGDTLLVMCRSGGRSAMAANRLAEAGYRNVYTITDGMEGDAVNDSSSVFFGQRLRNGWKNSGLPWTYAPDPGRMVLPGGH